MYTFYMISMYKYFEHLNYFYKYLFTNNIYNEYCKY